MFEKVAVNLINYESLMSILYVLGFVIFAVAVQLFILSRCYQISLFQSFGIFMLIGVVATFISNGISWVLNTVAVGT
jgi:hypothetical protein